MTDEAVYHNTFVIERTLDAAPARVFAAWANAEAKARWFIGPERWKLQERTLDFRVGGREVLQGTFPGGPHTLFVAHYHDIVPDQRIIYAYDMAIDEARISSSLVTVEIAATDGGTRMTVTEQGAYFGDSDAGAARERGVTDHIDKLVASL